MSKKNGTKKHGVVKWKKLKGVLDRSSGEFLPYPLPVSHLEIHDESWYSEQLGLRRDSQGEGDALCVEFKLQFFLPESDQELSYFLRRRARKLGVTPTELPSKATLEVTEEEDEAMYKARKAVRDALWFPILRWADLEEKYAPNNIYVPEKVPVAADPDLPAYFGPKDPAPIGHAVSSRDVRERALKHLRGKMLEVFDNYCRYWDRQYATVKVQDALHDD